MGCILGGANPNPAIEEGGTYWLQVHYSFHLDMRFCTRVGADCDGLEIKSHGPPDLQALHLQDCVIPSYRWQEINLQLKQLVQKVMTVRGPWQFYFLGLLDYFWCLLGGNRKGLWSQVWTFRSFPLAYCGEWWDWFQVFGIFLMTLKALYAWKCSFMHLSLSERIWEHLRGLSGF